MPARRKKNLTIYDTRVTTLTQDDEHIEHRSEPLGDERYHEGLV